MSEAECITFSEDEIVTKLRLNSDTTTEPIAPLNEEMDPELEKIQTLQRKKEIKEMQRIQEEFLKKYSYNGVIQSPQLASDLQYLVGKKFIDSENEGLYDVTEIFYNPEFNVVVGKRKSLDGRLTKFDDSQFCVYGGDGLLELTDVYSATQAEEVLWPTSIEVMAEYQQNDENLKQIIKLCTESDGFKCNWNKDQYCLQQVNDSDVSILYRERNEEPKDSVRYQLVVPKELQPTCMKLFHEGFSHPGSQRCLDTIKLYYYWDGHY
jgi:hypothetical protein